MTDRIQAGPSATLAVLLLAALAGTWWWRSAISRIPPIELKDEPSDRVKEQFPVPQEDSEPPRVSAEMIESVVRANPFSPKRRLAPPAAGGGAGPGASEGTAAAAPKFAYKGRINVGRQPRAIVEDTAAHKTYFLEVGQEVAGFKVLDIDEKRVVLSDPRTKEEIAVSLTP